MENGNETLSRPTLIPKRYVRIGSLMVRIPAIPLREVPRSLFTPIPPDPETINRQELEIIGYERSLAYLQEAARIYGAQANVWSRRSEAWLWLAWISFAFFIGSCIGLVLSLTGVF